jgi:hypothetical protein
MNIRTINTIAIAVMTAFLMTACGGSDSSDNSDSSDKKKSGDFPLEVEKTVSGAFSESFEVTNAVLKISEESFGTKLLVEIKRTSADLPLDPNDAQVCGVGAGKSFEWCISADVLGESNMPVETNLDKYGYDPFEKSLSLKSGETIWLEFSLGYNSELETDPSKAKKVKLTSSLEERDMSGYSSSSSSSTSSSSNSGSEDWDAVLKSYENYIDQYIKLMKKAKNGDASAMTEYVEMMEKATDLAEKMESAGDDLSTSQMNKFLKLQTKLANAAMEMY